MKKLLFTLLAIMAISTASYGYTYTLTSRNYQGYREVLLRFANKTQVNFQITAYRQYRNPNVAVPCAGVVANAGTLVGKNRVESPYGTVQERGYYYDPAGKINQVIAYAAAYRTGDMAQAIVMW